MRKCNNNRSFCNVPFWLAHHKMEKNNIIKTLEAPNIKICMWWFSASLSTHLYWWEGENFGQTIWDKNVTLLGKPLENILRTWGTSLRICGNTPKKMGGLMREIKVIKTWAPMNIILWASVEVHPRWKMEQLVKKDPIESMGS
jgi:hypothetical protein